MESRNSVTHSSRNSLAGTFWKMDFGKFIDTVKNSLKDRSLAELVELASVVADAIKVKQQQKDRTTIFKKVANKGYFVTRNDIDVGNESHKMSLVVVLDAFTMDRAGKSGWCIGARCEDEYQQRWMQLLEYGEMDNEDEDDIDFNIDADDLECQNADDPVSAKVSKKVYLYTPHIKTMPTSSQEYMCINEHGDVEYFDALEFATEHTQDCPSSCKFGCCWDNSLAIVKVCEKIDRKKENKTFKKRKTEPEVYEYK